MSRNGSSSSLAPAPGELTLPDAPSIPGLRFRRFRDPSDWAALAELHRVVAIADEDDEIPTPEILQIVLEHVLKVLQGGADPKKTMDDAQKLALSRVTR